MSQLDVCYILLHYHYLTRWLVLGARDEEDQEMEFLVRLIVNSSAVMFYCISHFVDAISLFIPSLGQSIFTPYHHIFLSK